MIYFENLSEEKLFNDYVDRTYIKYLHESHGISMLLIPIKQDIYNLIFPIFNPCTVYTGYNWDFSKDNLVKINDESKPYPLYIKLCIFKDPGKQGDVHRNINDEKCGITKITIEISLTCNDLDDTIIHELQHVRELYAKYDKNVLALNKTNIYANPNLEPDIKNLYKDILYMLSDTEQHAHLQSVYNYVLKHPEIKNIKMDDIKLRDISGVKDFYYYWQAFCQYSMCVKDIYTIQVLSLKFGLVLKKNFNYKNPNITKQYLNNIISGKIEYDKNIYESISDFIHSNLIKYQRKVARAIQYAIEKRDYVDPDNDDINNIVNNNYKNKYIK